MSTIESGGWAAERPDDLTWAATADHGLGGALLAIVPAGGLVMLAILFGDSLQDAVGSVGAGVLLTAVALVAFAACALAIIAWSAQPITFSRDAIRIARRPAGLRAMFLDAARLQRIEIRHEGTVPQGYTTSTVELVTTGTTTSHHGPFDPALAARLGALYGVPVGERRLELGPYVPTD